MATYGKFWQLVIIFGIFWHLWAPFGFLRHLLVTFDILWQLLAQLRATDDNFFAHYINLLQLVVIMSSYGNFWQSLAIYATFWLVLLVLATYGKFC